MINSKPRVGINLLHVIPGDVGGSEEYVVKVLDSLQNQSSELFEPIIFASKRFEDAYPEFCKKFQTVICPFVGKSRLKRIIAESTWLKIKTRHLQAVHHLGGRLPLLTKKPNLVTIHDLQPLDKPKNFTFIKRNYLRYVIPSTFRRADFIATVSQSVRDQIIDRFDLIPDSVHVVTMGVKEVVVEPNSPKKPATIFYPAVTHPHKNHQTLIKAFDEVAQKYTDVNLVMAGASGRSDDEVRKTISFCHSKERIFLLGRIKHKEIQEGFKNSTMVAFPSTYEGFGIPVLEAMALGVPVIVAKGTPATELPGPKSFKPSPYDVREWAQAMEKLLNDHELRNEIALENIELARKFLWSSTSDQLVESWKALLGMRKK